MNILCPFVDLYPETRECLDRDVGPVVRYIPLRKEDPEHYFWILRQMWALQQTVIVIEQDISWEPGQLNALWNCGRPWCAREYEMTTRFMAGLGFTKFSGAMMARYPDLWDRISRIDDDGVPPRHWVRNDTRMDRILHDDFNCDGPHIHQPPVRHLNPKQAILR